MTNALPATDRPDHDEQATPGDWQELRGELRSLLQQVDLRPAGDDQAQPAAGAAGDDERHIEALRSVNRAVARLNEREEIAEAETHTRAAGRNLVRDAIQQIRTRQPRPLESSVSHIDPKTPFASLATAITAANDRLGQIEEQLNEQRGTAANVKAIAGQISEITHVVELLAGAVGDNEETERLEAQIGALKDMVAEGARPDLSEVTSRLDALSQTVTTLADAQARHLESFNRLIDAQAAQGHKIDELSAAGAKSDLSYVTRRLDDVSATVERLADLQIQQVQQLAREAKDAPQRNEGMKAAVQSVEAAVRAIYDRIDDAEKARALPAEKLEGLSKAVAEFTAGMGQDGHTERLLALVEDMDGKLDGLASSAAVSELKADIEGLKTALADTIEPRFKAIEAQIGALDARIAEREQPSEAMLAQIEAQVRQLVARMDQTGEQLSSLARLYAEAEEAQRTPDLNALAEQVAARASEALAQAAPQAGVAELSEAGLASIEAHVSRLIGETGKARDADDADDVREGMKLVDDRLARIEASLIERAARPAPAPAVEAAEVRAESEREAIAPEPEVASQHEAAAPSPSAEAPKAAKARFDAMPQDPAVEAPLVDMPFDEPEPGHVASAADLGGFDVDVVEIEPDMESEHHAARPPRPVSSLEQDIALFEVTEEAAQDDNPFEAPAPSRNAFIAAHRAAQRSQAQQALPNGISANSIIGRALARFQSSEAEGDRGLPIVPEPVPEPIEAPRKLSRKERKAMARLDAVDAVEPVLGGEAEVTPADAEAVIEAVEDHVPAARREGFLTRHRRPVLLGASAVAIAALTVNLVAQRIGQDTELTGPNTDIAAAQAPKAIPEQAPPMAVAQIAKALPAQPRVIPLADTLTTGSISATPAAGFSKDAAQAAMPPVPMATAAAPLAPAADASSTAPAADTTQVAALPDSSTSMTAESPVKVEMPPAGIGPDPLREAAADGDARAQFEVAAIYTEGRAVPTDLKAAAVWYERAAAQGFAPAQYRLASLYETGKGVTKDLELARLWYQRAAEAGNRMSMHNLAALYAGGGLGKQDFPSAAEWFEQAAMRGMTDSQFNLGMLYARGLGVPQNLDTSYKWFSLASQSGDKDAAKARDDVARSLDAATVTRLQQEIAKWKPVPIDLAANFAPIGTWSKAFDPGEAINDKTVVTRVQIALERLGFDVGTPDGMAGPKTAEAIKAFEKATGMTQVGAVNPRLLAVLGSQPV